MLSFFKKKKDNQDQDIFDKVCELLKEIVPEYKSSDIKLDTSFSELGFNSIQYINLMLSLEDVVGVSLEEMVEKIDISTVSTIGDLVVVLRSFKS